jgi:hypothetical protein
MNAEKRKVKRSNLRIAVAVMLCVLGLSANAQSTCTPPPAGLVSWWRADFDANDQVGGNNGVLLSTTTFGPGEVGNAFQLDGISAGVEVPAATSLNVGQGSGLTVEAWVNTVYAANGQPVVEWNDYQNSGSFGVQLWVGHPSHSPGYFFANLVDTNGGYHVIDTVDGLVASNIFDHIAMTYDRASGQAVLYLNGALVASTKLGSFTPQTSYNLYIGQRPNSPFLFNGLIDETSLYDRALTAAEIQAIYNAGGAGKCLTSAPVITAQPANQIVRPGTNVTISATVAGSPPLNYQWYFNSNQIPGAMSLTLTITNAQLTNSGAYALWVNNGYGTVLSSNAVLKVVGVFAYGNGVLLTNSTQSFGGPVSIQLQTVFTNGLIFYTLDGSEPSFASTQYTGVFTLHQNAVLRAIAYSADFFQSSQTDPMTILIVPSYTLTVTGTGGGRLLVSPSASSYLSNATVTLTAVPTNGWTFLQWLGDLTGTNATNTIVMSRKKSVQAVFGTTLNTTVAGAGAVAVNPSGGVYPYGSAVRLTGVPQPGNYFGLWGNAGSGNVNPLTFVVTNPNPTVSSLFAAVGSGQAALTVEPIGNGGVTVNPRANIYSVGQMVSITAAADTNQSFIGWAGDVVSTQNPISVVMNQSKLIYANFTHKPALALRPISGGFKPEGFVISLTGDFGAGYQFLISSNLLNWVPIATVTNTFGTVQFIDAAATNRGTRLYKAQLQ